MRKVNRFYRLGLSGRLSVRFVVRPLPMVSVLILSKTAAHAAAADETKAAMPRARTRGTAGRCHALAERGISERTYSMRKPSIGVQAGWRSSKLHAAADALSSECSYTVAEAHAATFRATYTMQPTQCSSALILPPPFARLSALARNARKATQCDWTTLP